MSKQKYKQGNIMAKTDKASNDILEEFLKKSSVIANKWDKVDLLHLIEASMQFRKLEPDPAEEYAESTRFADGSLYNADQKIAAFEAGMAYKKKQCDNYWQERELNLAREKGALLHANDEPRRKRILEIAMSYDRYMKGAVMHERFPIRELINLILEDK